MAITTHKDTTNHRFTMMYPARIVGSQLGIDGLTRTWQIEHNSTGSSRSACSWPRLEVADVGAKSRGVVVTCVAAIMELIKIPLENAQLLRFEACALQGSKSIAPESPGHLVAGSETAAA